MWSYSNSHYLINTPSRVEPSPMTTADVGLAARAVNQWFPYVAHLSGFIVLYLITLAVQRLFLSPLAQIPGPKLAALTYYYQSYYELFPHRGQFLFRCEELHKKYGPVIRIGPDEVHINDPWYWDETYPGPSRRRHKSPLFYWMGGIGSFGDQSMFTTLDHNHHRLRRAALGTYFSKQKVRQLEPRLKSKVLLLKQRLLERKAPQSVNLKDAFSALTLDVISMYSFGGSIGALDRPDLGASWNDLVHFAIKLNPFARAFPFLARQMLNLPKWTTSWSPSFQGATEFIDIIFDLTRAAMDEALADKSGGKGMDDADQRTVIHSMIQNDALPEHEKTLTRLANDGLVLVAAGYITTSSTLAVTMYHVLAKPHIRSRVLAELRTVMPTPASDLPSLVQLEQLPYLTAVIHEGTRVAHGAAGRHVRIAPDEDLSYSSRDGRWAYRIPSGTTFSQSIYLAHVNEELYPRPWEFDPERYYREDGSITDAQRHLVAFGRGARQCVGTNLSWAELYLTIAALVGSLDMELAPETTEKEATLASEFFVGLLPEDGPGIKVFVKGEL
ncbi:cytochrome P450-like protein [Camillea tinctor]|nr:cytochrome P450-like protein [Camillea tinctor]